MFSMSWKVKLGLAAVAVVALGLGGRYVVTKFSGGSGRK